jgi:hypothetical protein
MGVLAVDDPKVVLISPGEHLIEASATVGAATVRTRVQVDKVEKTVEIQLKNKKPKSDNDSQSKPQQAETPRTPAQVEAALKTTCTDPATGLMWTREDNNSDVGWPEANAYCSKLNQAGYDGWRLPTLDELQGIYDPGVSTQTLFGHDVAVNVHVKGNLKVTGWTWGDRQGDYPGKPYQTAWFIELGAPPDHSFDVGKPLSNFLHFDWHMRALCVRRAGE